MDGNVFRLNPLNGIFRYELNLKTAVHFNAEARCARDEVVGLSERSEPEGPQGAARRKVTQSESEILWKNGKYENFSDGVNLHPLGVACMVL